MVFQEPFEPCVLALPHAEECRETLVLWICPFTHYFVKMMLLELVGQVCTLSVLQAVLHKQLVCEAINGSALARLLVVSCGKADVLLHGAYRQYHSYHQQGFDRLT